ncbi:TPA: hypothetical protein ACH3X2_005281 [Trebouxia sp. C0005]
MVSQHCNDQGFVTQTIDLRCAAKGNHSPRWHGEKHPARATFVYNPVSEHARHEWAQPPKTISLLLKQLRA